MKKQRLAIFDVDDTLVYTSKNAYKKAALVAARMQMTPPTREAFFTVYGRYDYEDCVRSLHPGVDLDAYKRNYDEAKKVIPYEPIGKVDSIFSDLLQNDFSLGILSNGPGYKTDVKLNMLKITGALRKKLLFVLHANNNSHRKPDPQCFDPVCSIINEMRISHAYYIGDCVDDLTASRGAGIHFIAVTSGYTSRETFIEAGLPASDIIGNINDVFKYFGI